jgi:hypothetical protein
MILTIKDDRKISEVQESFNTRFPYLKLEFFKKMHGVKELSPLKGIIDSNKTIGQIRTIHSDGFITVTPKMTVAELEQEFGRIFGLSAQVFRKSGKMWIETTVTDKWTLEQQNSEGEALTIEQKPARTDYTEWED